MHFTEIKNVIIPENRQRREFDKAKIDELAESIAGPTGLHHPIRLRNDGRTLIAGERRLKAINALYLAGRGFTYNGVRVPFGQVPYTLASELTPLQLREAELEENTVRSDLTWLERTTALAELHRLRVEQAAERGEKHTFRDTATEVAGRPLSGGTYDVKVRHSLLITDYKDDPEVASAKSEKEAFNIVKRKLQEKLTAKLAENIRAEKIATPHTLIRGDCLTELAQLPVETFDVIIADPPYGIGAHKFTATDGSDSGTRHSYDDTPEYAWNIMMGVVQQGFRLARRDAALYIFCDFGMFEALHSAAALAGWTPWPRPILWVKPSGGMMGDTLHGPRRAYETILFAYKGNKRTTGAFLDVIVHQPTEASRHAAEKPVEVYENLLKRSAVPGMMVLDPCAGTGPVFPAANRLQLRATGIELDERYYNLALTRINEKE